MTPLSQKPAYQATVADFVSRHNLEAPPTARLLDLVAEVGELAKELVNGSEYGRRDLSLPSAWADELGDVFFSLICLANATDVSLDRALAIALEKYEQRLAQRGEAGSGH